MRGVAFAAVDLLYANKLLIAALPYEGATMTFLNDRGRVLAVYPDPAGLTGKSMPDSLLLRTIQAKGGEGVAQVAGLDGVPSLIAFASISRSPERIVYLTMGVPKDGRLSCCQASPLSAGLNFIDRHPAGRRHCLAGQ